MKEFNRFRIGTYLSVFATFFPFLGLLKQLVEPTGDILVVIILGGIVSVFFIMSIFLLYVSFDYKKFLNKKKICRIIAFLFIVYPFLGILPSIILLQTTKNERR